MCAAVVFQIRQPLRQPLQVRPRTQQVMNMLLKHAGPQRSDEVRLHEGLWGQLCKILLNVRMVTCVHYPHQTSDLIDILPPRVEDPKRKY